MKAILVLIAALAFAITPFLSPEFGGFDPNLYPMPQDDPPVQPAGWAFSIWGLIYVLLIAHAVYGLIQHRHDDDWQKGRIALIVSLAIGAAWLPIALVSPLWATVLIWVMLVSVILALYQTEKARPTWQSHWPLALYAGWLTAASFVSIGLLLAGYGVVSELTAAIVALALATGFAAVNQISLGHWPYGAGVAWGFVGIAAKNSDSQMLISSLAAAAALFIIGILLNQARRT
jgi:tryptophan-rich sensory protein